MTISKWATKDKVSPPIDDSKRLVLAMSPIDVVLETFCSHFMVREETSTITAMGIGTQDDFAQMVDSCWTEFGPSERYIKRLIMQFVRLAEKNGTDIESDSLADLVARVSFIKTSCAPHTLESCYVSFFLDHPETNNEHIPLRIRIFPYHNDVALRLWEAGNCLAEFFIQNPSIVSGKALIELGSGCGATGLAIAACCKPATIHLTDYTETCQLNIEHNLVVNEEWLSHYNFSSERISQSHLEWEAFGNDYTPKIKDVDDKADSKEEAHVFNKTFEAFSQADVLIAADVIYDIDTIDHLVNVVKCFLVESPTSKQTIFACTKRNATTFAYFLETIIRYGMTYTWLARNEDCEALNKIFEGNHSQKRSDVQICSIQMTSTKGS